MMYAGAEVRGEVQADGDPLYWDAAAAKLLLAGGRGSAQTRTGLR